jgi:hypothetical protein
VARGTFRKKRDRVLEELREHDASWADQLTALRSTNPQAYRKGVLKADVWIAARTGRPTTLGMRPKRYGGDEDPALVRRVQDLRRHYRQLAAKIVLPPPKATPRADVEPGAEPGRQGPTAERPPAADMPPAPGGRPNQRAASIAGDMPPASGGRPNQRAATIAGDMSPASGGRPNQRAATISGDMPPASGGRPVGLSPALVRGVEPGASPAPPAAASAASEPRSAASSGPDLDAVLAGSIADIKAALESGAFDAHLAALSARERDGKARKGVLKAIEARG